MGEGEGGGDLRDYFTASGGRVGVKSGQRLRQAFL